MKITFLNPPKKHRKQNTQTRQKHLEKKINSSASGDGGGNWKNKHIYAPETSMCPHLWIL